MMNWKVFGKMRLWHSGRYFLYILLVGITEITKHFGLAAVLQDSRTDSS